MKRIRLTKTEWITGFSLLFFYAVALWSLLTQQRHLPLIFFILHGCLALLFFLAGQENFVQNLLESMENAPPQQEWERRLLQHTEEISSLKQERDALLAEKSSLLTQLEAWKSNSAGQEERDRPDAYRLLPAQETCLDVDLNDLAEKIIDDMTPRCRLAGIRLSLSRSGDRLFCHGDRSLLQLLFCSVIDNSLKYTNGGGSLVITLSALGDTILIVFKDDGAGLPSQETAHIFDLNYQGANRINGTGLGLTQVKAIVTHYGGNVYAKSDSGAGMAVYILLPASVRASTEKGS